MILLTGGTGFVGRAVLDSLEKKGSVRLALRGSLPEDFSKSVEYVRASLSPDQDWTGAVAGVSVVLHCAARVHVMNENSADPLREFRRVNVEGTLCLARQAAKAGVRRFLFVSSIGVNGGETFGHPFSADGQVAPHSPYALSKHEAEVGLLELAHETGMEVVIIRPPLVYGPNAPGNFSTLMKWLNSEVPLPLGAVTGNRRSLVALDNLVDLIATCIDHPAAANQTFLVSDGESLSTTDLLRRMGEALGLPARLVPVPVSLLRFGAQLLGKGDMVQRLLGSLEVDISKTRELLGWTPPISVSEGLRKTAKHWLASRHRINI